MNISNFNFEKNIFRKSNNIYQLEIILSSFFNNIEYKIYGEKECITYGNIYLNENKTKNMIILNLDSLENIFIIVKKDNSEYFQYVNLIQLFNENNKKNIKMDIKRRILEKDDLNKIIKLYQKNEGSEDDSDSEDDSEEEEDDSEEEEDSDSEEDEKEKDDNEDDDNEDDDNEEAEEDEEKTPPVFIDF
jgi:hypothetical protein